MYMATFIANPEEPVLSVANMLPFHRRMGGGDFHWLRDGVAAEFEIAEIPADRRAIWQELQDRGVDMVIQPSRGRRKRLLLADMDSTMIGQECIDELADMAGVGERVADITARAMNGELLFEDALRERVGLLKDLDAAIIDRVLDERITLAPGAEELLTTMKANGVHCALVSGGFTAFTSRVAEVLGFDEHRANTLLIENGVLTGQVQDPIVGQDAKVRALRDLTSRLGIENDQVMAVGDGANDLGMIKLAGAGVALHAKPAVAAQAEICINHGDLTALLFMQGYATGGTLRR